MLDKDFQIFIRNMSKVLEELNCQGEVLFHLEIHCPIESCKRIVLSTKLKFLQNQCKSLNLFQKPIKT
jgi:hypothetical protein